MLTDRATDIIVRYNTQGVIEFASPSVREMGYEPEALIGRNLAELTHPDDRLRTKALQGEVSTGRTLAAHERDEIRARRANGEWIWLQGNPAPIFDHGCELGLMRFGDCVETDSLRAPLIREPARCALG